MSVRRRRDAEGELRRREALKALRKAPVDIRSLRAMACRPRGFLDEQLRGLTWPRLMGVRPDVRLPQSRESRRGGGGGGVVVVVVVAAAAVDMALA